jgi:hypothetical protein
MSPVEQFLNGLLSPVGAGALLWMLMGTIFKAAPNLNGELKFWITMTFAFLIPPAAYGLRIYLGYDVFTTEGMLLAIGIGYLVSQGVHRGSQEIRAAVADTKAPGEV